MNIDLINKLWSRTVVDSTTRCWLWTGALNKGSYGVTRYNNTHWYVHRWSLCIYLKLSYNGNWETCHTCKNKNCWNPCHLYVGNHLENMQDKFRDSLHHNLKKTHCPANHPYDKTDSYGYRHCSICDNISNLKSLKKFRDRDAKLCKRTGESLQ